MNFFHFGDYIALNKSIFDIKFDKVFFTKMSEIEYIHMLVLNVINGISKQ